MFCFKILNQTKLILRFEKKKEKNLLNDLYLANSNILNVSVEEGVKRMLEEFRNPNIFLANIKSSINKQQSIINQLKANINNFKLKVYQTKTFYFTPNLNNENKTFDDLNLTGSKLISCSADKTIKIWDLETFECLKTLNGHSDRVKKIEKLPNDRILSCSSDHTIKLWDIGTGFCLKTYNHGFEVGCLKSLSDKTFASGSKEIKIWNIGDEKCIKTLNGHTSYVRDLLLLPNQMDI